MLKYLYTLLSSSVLLLSSNAGDVLAQLDSTNLPLVIINTNGKYIQDEPKVDTYMKIIYNESGYNKPTDNGNIYDGNAGIEIRGAYSASLPQKPYGIETRDNLGQNLNVPIFHMPAENDWILLANYNDKVFIRNSLSFELFRKMGHYAPRTMHCEVIVNNSYEGIYVFTEKIKRDNGRIDIAELTPLENTGDDVTGGYVFKIDYYYDGNSWKSSYPAMGYPGKEVFFVYSYPAPEDISSQQKNYIRNFVNNFETTLYAQNTPAQKQKLEALMDEQSFIDYFLLNELARNVDGYKKSSYFYKDKDSKDGRLHAGPVWDFDWAWKNINECYFGNTDGSGWAFKVHDCNNWPTPPTWMNKLLADRSFARNTAERYFALRENILSETYLYNYIDSVALVLEKAQKRHYSKWRILGQNVGTPEVDAQPTTFAGEVTKFKNWIGTRLRWLDTNIAEFIITGIPEEADAASTLLYPNPSSGIVGFRTNKAISGVELLTNSGMSMMKQVNPASTEINLDVSTLPVGLYIARITFVDGSTRSEKLVLNQ